MHGSQRRRLQFSKPHPLDPNKQPKQTLWCFLAAFVGGISGLAVCILYLALHSEAEISTRSSLPIDEAVRPVPVVQVRVVSEANNSLFRSQVHLDAEPILIGLGAEKSGSTSLGAALYDSGEFSCPKTDSIDVETKYWSDCMDWTAQQQQDLTQAVLSDSYGRCSMAQYESFGRWRGDAKFKFEKSVDYLGLPYVARVLSDIYAKQHGTKIFVMIRYAPPRIASTWRFFVGAEKDQMPEQYGNVAKFTRHLLGNKVMHDMIGLLDSSSGKTVMQLDWTGLILPKWNDYMLSLQTQCKQEAPIAGFPPAYCNPSQLLRRAVGLSCYIIPVMQWVTQLGVDQALHSFRIIQSELYFQDGKDVMDRLICWTKQGTDIDTCDTTGFYESGSVNIKKLQSTVKSGNSKVESDFGDELISTLHSTFEPCNQRLSELLNLFPQLALKEFVWEHWHVKPLSA